MRATHTPGLHRDRTNPQSRKQRPSTLPASMQAHLMRSALAWQHSMRAAMRPRVFVEVPMAVVMVGVEAVAANRRWPRADSDFRACPTATEVAHAPREGDYFYGKPGASCL